MSTLVSSVSSPMSSSVSSPVSSVTSPLTEESTTTTLTGDVSSPDPDIPNKKPPSIQLKDSESTKTEIRAAIHANVDQAKPLQVDGKFNQFWNKLLPNRTKSPTSVEEIPQVTIPIQSETATLQEQKFESRSLCLEKESDEAAVMPDSDHVERKGTPEMVNSKEGYYEVEEWNKDSDSESDYALPEPEINQSLHYVNTANVTGSRSASPPFEYRCDGDNPSPSPSQPYDTDTSKGSVKDIAANKPAGPVNFQVHDADSNTAPEVGGPIAQEAIPQNKDTVLEGSEGANILAETSLTALVTDPKGSHGQLKNLTGIKCKTTIPKGDSDIEPQIKSLLSQEDGKISDTYGVVLQSISFITANSCNEADPVYTVPEKVFPGPLIDNTHSDVTMTPPVPELNHVTLETETSKPETITGPPVENNDMSPMAIQSEIETLQSPQDNTCCSRHKIPSAEHSRSTCCADPLGGCCCCHDDKSEESTGHEDPCLPCFASIFNMIPRPRVSSRPMSKSDGPVDVGTQVDEDLKSPGKSMKLNLEICVESADSEVEVVSVEALDTTHQPAGNIIVITTVKQVSASDDTPHVSESDETKQMGQVRFSPEVEEMVLVQEDSVNDSEPETAGLETKPIDQAKDDTENERKTTLGFAAAVKRMTLYKRMVVSKRNDIEKPDPPTENVAEIENRSPTPSLTPDQQSPVSVTDTDVFERPSDPSEVLSNTTIDTATSNETKKTLKKKVRRFFNVKKTAKKIKKRYREMEREYAESIIIKSP